MPVLPDVGSRIVCPGAIAPFSSASSISARATRSLTEPVGLCDSSLAHTCTPGLGDSRGSSTSGVFPIDCTMSPYRPPQGRLLSRSAAITSLNIAASAARARAPGAAARARHLRAPRRLGLCLLRWPPAAASAARQRGCACGLAFLPGGDALVGLGARAFLPQRCGPFVPREGPPAHDYFVADEPAFDRASARQGDLRFRRKHGRLDFACSADYHFVFAVNLDQQRAGVFGGVFEFVTARQFEYLWFLARFAGATRVFGRIDEDFRFGARGHSDNAATPSYQLAEVVFGAAKHDVGAFARQGEFIVGRSPCDRARLFIFFFCNPAIFVGRCG